MTPKEARTGVQSSFSAVRDAAQCQRMLPFPLALEMVSLVAQDGFKPSYVAENALDLQFSRVLGFQAGATVSGLLVAGD